MELAQHGIVDSFQSEYFRLVQIYLQKELDGKQILRVFFKLKNKNQKKKKKKNGD